MTARLRSAAQRAPQTREQASALLARFAGNATRLGEIAARRASVHAKVDAICAAAIVPLEAEQADIVKQLKPWWAANVEELTGGKRKSIELAGCLLGYRVSPPAVHFAGGKDDAATAALVSAELASLVRTKPSPDKPAILTALQFAVNDDAAEPDPRAATRTQLEALGFSVRQPEQFFVDLAARDQTAPASVPSDDEVR